MSRESALRIGVDVSSLANPITGIGRYTDEVLSRLIQNTSIEFVLYTSHPLKVRLNLKSNVKIRVSRFCGFRFTGLLWRIFYIPILVSCDKVDIFWAPTHRLPFFLPSRVKKIITVHDVVCKLYPQTMKFFGRWIDIITMHYSLKVADKVISVSHTTANDLSIIYNNINLKNINVIYLGVTVLGKKNIYSQAPSFGSYILFVGTLEPRKNLERIIVAFSKIPIVERLSIKLLLVGLSGWGSDLKKLIDLCGLQNDIEIMGYVTDEELGGLYENALFLALPSLYEGFGLPLVEAMSFGTPILTSNCSSMKEVVGECAVLVNPLVVNEITVGMQNLINSPSLRSQLSEKGLKRSKLYNWDQCANQTLQTILEA